MLLNRVAYALVEKMVEQADVLRVRVDEQPDRARLIDCGIEAPGGLEAGRRLAEISTAGLAEISFVPASPELWQGPAVQLRTDHPIEACMATQYAGWPVAGKGYFAMGSGPMRAAAAREDLYVKLGHQEVTEHAVGVLESSKLPPTEVCHQLAAECGVDRQELTLLVAPTASIAGSIQVVARSVETALHKLFQLGFDLRRVKSGIGTAPLPPVAASDLTGMGRTNDAILYGGEVTLYVRGDDESLRAVGAKVPSSTSGDYGQPFLRIFEQNDRDFYKIDPHLFSPAVITLVNMDSGNSFRYGHTVPRVIHESFGMK